MRPYLVNKKIIKKMYKKKYITRKNNKKIEYSINFNFLIVIFIILTSGLMYYRYLEKNNKSQL